MDQFVSAHRDSIVGHLSVFDRMIFHGHLPINHPKGLAKFMSSRGVRLKEFACFWKRHSEALKDHAMEMAKREGRPYEYLRRKMPKKDEYARKMAQRDKIERGLVCVLATTEHTRSFSFHYGKGKASLVSCCPAGLTLYFYFMDEALGLIHIRLQTWVPFLIQVYVNGHEWLARQLTRHGVGFEKCDNVLTWVEDFAAAQRIADGFARERWPNRLRRLARRVNVLQGSVLRGMKYYWVTAQSEYATDIVFKDRAALEGLYKKLQEHSALCTGAEDILVYFGKPSYCPSGGEVTAHLKKRYPGTRLKHVLRDNWIKMYDKSGVVLRVETVINEPHIFNVYRRGKCKGVARRGWFPMAKRVSNLRHYEELCRRANRRYLDALAVVDDPTPAQRLLHRTCAPAFLTGHRHRPLNPLGADLQIFRALMRGEHFVHGFKNSDLARALGIIYSDDTTERKRQSARTNRIIRILRAHHLLAKVPHSRRYRITRTGIVVMNASIDIADNAWQHVIYKKAA